MDYRQYIEAMSPEVYERLKRAVELGKWPDGRALTEAQRRDALQAVIAWDALHVAAPERVGFIDNRRRADQTCEEPGPRALQWVEGERGGE